MKYETSITLAYVLLGLILLIGGLVMIGGLLELITRETMRIEKTECYDVYYNEIKDLKCEEEIKCGVISKLFREGCYG